MLAILLAAILGQTLQADLDALVASPPTHVYRLTASHTLNQTLRLPSNLTFTCAEGTVIEAAAGAFTEATDVPDASLIALEGVENVTIIGCTFRMRKADYQKAPYVPSEFRHAIRVTSSKNIKIDKVVAESSGGDGLCLSVKPGVTPRIPNENITVTNSTFRNNHRQGVSVVTCVNCRFSDSEFSGTKGAAPQCGFLAEASHVTDRMTNIVVERCTSFGNGGCAFGVQMDRQNQTSAPVSITFTDNIAKEMAANTHMLRVDNYGFNNFNVKPKGSIVWDKSSWKNE